MLTARSWTAWMRDSEVGRTASFCLFSHLSDGEVLVTNFWGNKRYSINNSMMHPGSFGLCDYRVACLPNFQLMITIRNYWYTSDSVQGVDIQVSFLRVMGLQWPHDRAQPGPVFTAEHTGESLRKEGQELVSRHREHWSERTNSRLKRGGGDPVWSRHFWDNCILWRTHSRA